MYRYTKFEYPNKIIVPVGCVGTVFGYWPTKEMLKEGGYEVNGFKEGFLLKHAFIKSQLEAVFFDSVNTLIK